MTIITSRKTRLGHMAKPISSSTVHERLLRILNDECNFPGCTAAEAAEKTIAYLREHAPELLDEYALFVLTRELRKYFRLARSTSALAQSKEGSQRALEAQFDAAVTDVDARGEWFSRTHDVSGTTKTVADMTGDDHQSVADARQVSGQRDLLLAAFHRRVSRIVGQQRTADAMSEADYDRMFRTVVQGDDDEWEL